MMRIGVDDGGSRESPESAERAFMRDATPYAVGTTLSGCYVCYIAQFFVVKRELYIDISKSSAIISLEKRFSSRRDSFENRFIYRSRKTDFLQRR